LVFDMCLRAGEEARAESAEVLRINHKFTVADLMFLKNGGRIPPALAAIGTVLNLKPIMSVDQNGKLIQNTKVRGRKKVYRTFINHLNEKYTDKDSPIIIGHGDCYDDALTLRQLIEDEFAPNEIYIADVSPTIGAHVGPGLMLLGFLGDSR